MVEWTLIVGLALVLALPLARRVAARSFDPFEPIVVFAVAYGTMFVVRPADMLIEDRMGFWGLDVRPTLPLALLLAQAGGVAFVCAYELPPGRAIARRLPAPRPLNSRRAARAALLVAGLGVVALLVSLRADPVEAARLMLSGRSAPVEARLEDVSTYLVWSTWLVIPAAVVLIGLALHERSRVLGAAAAALSALTLLISVPSGGRIALLALLGGTFVLVYVVRGRRPSVAVFAALTAAALVTSYSLIYLRDPDSRASLRPALTGLVRTPSYALDPVLRGQDAEMVAALSAALTVVPDDLPYRWGGATLGNLVTRPIPRQVWKDKPRTPGQTIVATLYPRLYPDLNPAFTPLLPLYWDFAVIGVLAGMALFGVAARALFEWFSQHRYSLAAQLMFSMSLWFIVIGARNDPVDTVVLAAFLLLPILVVSAVAGTASTPRPRSLELTRTAALRGQAGRDRA